MSQNVKKIVEEGSIPGFELSEIIYYPEHIADRIIVLGIYNGKKTLLKMVDSQNVNLMDKLQREIRAGEAISELFSQETASNFPAIYKSSVQTNYSYLIRSYFEGQPLADYKTDENSPTIVSYEHLVKISGRNHEAIISGVANILVEMRNFDPKIAIKYSEILKRRFEFDINRLDIARIEEGYGISLDHHLKFCNDVVAINLHQQYLSPTVSDLVPANIIVEQDSIKIIDIEWFSIDHQMIDVAMLWLTVHTSPELQELLMQKFVNDDLAETLFRYSVIRIILSYKWYGWLKKRNHIWSRYIVAAGESFGALAKVR